jgi:flagellin-like protein
MERRGRRKAISPVIATVILIAVAVALGIAVAVWAGALTSSLQRNDKLIVIRTWVTGGLLNIQLQNMSPYAVSISVISFNNEPVPLSDIISGDYSNIASAASTVLVLNVTGQSGITYPVTIMLTSGTSYPSEIAWP